MKTLIVTPKASGNTYKAACAMQEASSADLCILDKGEPPHLKSYPKIILCTGIYGGKIHKNLRKFLESRTRTDFSPQVKIGVYLTWFGRGTSDQQAFDQIQKLLKAISLKADENYGSCYGGMAFVRSGHPDKQDLEDAAAWQKDFLAPRKPARQKGRSFEAALAEQS